ncbi:ThiF family adenylyltransferase, partial [Patescibacteria group bacterium]|nr:ThiF family adenylyltransferase [Patescibacteria group bacterium]
MNKENNFLYEDIFSRNIGIFSYEEIKKIKALKVGIVGAGALGGSTATMLARLGVGEIRIIDPEDFEISNINRQFCAYVDTVGKNKAQMVKKELIRINPNIKVVALSEGISNSNVDEFLLNIDVIIDAIEFFEIEKEKIIYTYARNNRIWVFTAQAVNNLFTVTCFDPSGKSFEEIILDDGKINLRSIIDKFFPVLPKEATKKLINEVIDKKELHISSYSVPAPLGASFVVNELIKKI